MKWVIDIYNFMTNRYVPVILVLFSLILFVAFDGYQLFNFRAMQLQEDRLHVFVGEQWFFTSIVFVLVYAAFVGISATGAFILAILGGFVFGPFWGGIIASIASTLGALVIFEITHRAIGDDIDKRLTPFSNEIKQGFSNHGFLYMLILRVAPFLPLWVINLVPALLGVSRKMNALITFIGVAPTNFVYAALGAGAASILQRWHLLDISNALTDSAIILPLYGIVFIGVLPLAAKTWCDYIDHKSFDPSIKN